MLTDEQKKTNEEIWAKLKKLRRFNRGYNRVCERNLQIREERDQALDELDKAQFDLARARNMIKSLRRRLAEAKGIDNADLEEALLRQVTSADDRLQGLCDGVLRVAGEHRRAGVALAALVQEQGGRIAHLAQARVRHLEHPDLVSGAEAVLGAAQDAEGVAPLALE